MTAIAVVYESPSVKLEAPPPGVTAAVTAESGKLGLEGSVILAGHRRVRCDKDKHFIVERFDYMFLEPFKLWEDTETVTVSDAGGIVEVPYTFSFGADSWDERYTAKVPTGAPFDPANYIALRTSPVKPESTDDWFPQIGPEANKAASGSCSPSFSLQECSSYSFNATFKGEGLPG